MNFTTKKYFQLAQQVLNAYDELDAFWVSNHKESIQIDFNQNEIDIIKQLILTRLDILNSFEILVKADLNEAISILNRRYFGKHVDPDTKYGGFEFEISSMLSDVVEFAGEKALINILTSEKNSTKILNDERVLRAIEEAMDFGDLDEVRSWLSDIQKK